MPSIQHNFAKLAVVTSSALGFLFQATPAMAQITNPVIGNLGNDATKASSGALFINYFVMLWQAMINVGALLVLVYFAWGAIDWITAGGDKAKVSSAQAKITNAVIGVIILVSSFTIIGFISNLFFGAEFNLLKLTFPNPLGTSSTPSLPPLPAN